MVGNYLDGLVMVNRHRGISPRRVPSRVVAELGRGTGILILYSALFCGIALADTPPRQELPMRAIVRGHNVQPRGDQLKALGYSDLTPQQASEVDRLYRELLKNSDAADRTSLLRRHLGLDSGSQPFDG
jgi:hypothetical protein